MRQYVNSFYKTLYTSEDIDNEKYEDVLNSVDSVVFEEDVMDDLSRDFDENEIFNAVKQISKEKSPGLDGLTAEFYQLFLHILKNDFKDVVTECKRKGNLPFSMNTAIIRLIFKNKGERNN